MKVLPVCRLPDELAVREKQHNAWSSPHFRKGSEEGAAERTSTRIGGVACPPDSRRLVRKGNARPCTGELTFPLDQVWAWTGWAHAGPRCK
jgi:hypothetical protein